MSATRVLLQGESMVTRRAFLDALALGAAGLAVGTTAKSYGQILGSNDRLNFAVIGLNGRAYAHLASLKANRSAARISHVCDVDSVILKKFADRTQLEMGEAPVAEKDFRKILEEKSVDAITIATPEHWHAPMAIAGLQAGEHVYGGKPCSHNPAEGEMLVQAQQKYRKLVQMGTQQRSSPHTIEIVEKIHEGIIGRPYFGKAWYVNKRKAIGTFKEDWQFYDKLVTSFEYEDKVISWEGKSCQGMRYYGRDRGSTVMGTTGTVLINRGGYEIYDLRGNKTSEFKAGHATSSADLIGSDSMTDLHFANFIAGIRKGEKLNAPISVGNVSVTMLQLSNLAWEVNRELHLDTKDGRIQADPEAMKMWGREYEKGWAPHV